MGISEQIKLLRKRKGITQEDLASALGVKRTTITQYEAGRIFPSHEILRKMASFFGVTMDELAGELPGNEQTAPFPNLANAPLVAGSKDYAKTMKQLIAQKLLFEMSKKAADEFIIANSSLFQQLFETILDININALKADHPLTQVLMEGDSPDLSNIVSEFSKELYRMEKITELLES